MRNCSAKSLAYAWTEWVRRHSSAILLFCAMLTAASVYYTVKLYQNLRTEVSELLPAEARSVRDLERVRNRLASTETLAVLFFSENPEASKRFVTDLARAIEYKLPSGLVSHVEYRIDKEMRFYKERLSLMMDLPDLVRLRDYVRSRLDYERKLRNPLTIFSGTNLPEPKLGREVLTEKYTRRVADYAKFKDGFYATPDGKIRALLIHVTGGALNVKAATELRSGVDRLIARLNPASYDPGMRIRFSGDVQNLIDEHQSLIRDLEVSTLIVAVLVALSMVVYFKDEWSTAALITSLFAGTLWTFGLTYFMTGFLNANSAFLGSIVLGNGINFSIVLLARYLEERHRKKPHASSLNVAIRGAGPGTLIAALSAGLAYGSLILTQFRGFNQFGLIGLVGMILCWISAFTLLPALLTFLDRWKLNHRAIDRARPELRRRGIASLVARAVARFPRTILVASLVLTLGLGVLALGQKQPWLETDTSKLRDRHSMESGSGYYSGYLDRIFGKSLSPLVVLTSSMARAHEIARLLKEVRDREGDKSLIANVYSIEDFVPRDQARKIAILYEIRSMLPPRIIERLEPRYRTLARELLGPANFRTFSVKDLPPLVKARFREKDGTIGNLVLVEPVFAPVIMNQYANQERIIQQVRGVVDVVDPGAPVVGQLPLTVDLNASLIHDGPKATLTAFIAVIILVALLFRKARTTLQALFALLLGVAWMLAIARATGLKANFFNFIALPITFGIGVDYGVNVLARERQEGVGALERIISTTGGAVALASLTTIIGYGSLLIAGNRGFVSFGRLAILGELTCLPAAILVLPALLHWLEDRRARREARRIPPSRPPRKQAPPPSAAA